MTNWKERLSQILLVIAVVLTLLAFYRVNRG
jgi:hypothetical protein